MNKQEFLDKLNCLKYSGSYNSENGYWDKERGFDKCKEEVIKLAYQLDEQGLTFEAYNLFRQQTNDLRQMTSRLFILNYSKCRTSFLMQINSFAISKPNGGNMSVCAQKKSKI